MNILNFLDANVWLALLWGRHIHSEKAQAWFEQSGDEEFFFCRITQIRVLRLLTTPTIMGNNVKTMGDAWVLWTKSAPTTGSHWFPNRRSSTLSFAGYPRFAVLPRRYGLTHIFSLSPRWPV
jgi:hypothetical protein